MTTEPSEAIDLKRHEPSAFEGKSVAINRTKYD